MPTFFDQVSTTLGALGAGGTALAIAAVPVAVGIATYVTRMGSQAKIDRLEGELKRAEAEKSEATTAAAAQLAALQAKYDEMRRSGALIRVQLDAIESEASEIAERLDAEEHAVLVAAPTLIAGDEPQQLVFLCASGPQADTLKRVRVPIATSMSGQVFTSGQATIATPPDSGAAFASRTDQVSNFRTREALSVCLRHRNGRVGVAQFLNKRSGRFDSTDIDRALQLCATLTVRVADLVADPRRLAELGHAPRQNQSDAITMFVDVSHSTSLFQHHDNSVVADLLNQFFQDLCDVALRHGAVVDQIIGDGMLLVFGAGRGGATDPDAALAAARAMREAFGRLRQRWSTLGYAGTAGLFVRFGLSCGKVTRVELGHSQIRRGTVLGAAVHEASEACENGPRDADTICVTDAFRLAHRGLPEAGLTARRTGRGVIYEVPRT